MKAATFCGDQCAVSRWSSGLRSILKNNCVEASCEMLRFWRNSTGSATKGLGTAARSSLRMRASRFTRWVGNVRPSPELGPKPIIRHPRLMSQLYFYPNLSRLFNHLQPLCPRIANRRFHNRIGRLELRFRTVPESPIQIYACHGAARLINPKIPPRTPFPAAAEVSQRDNVTPKSPPNSPSTHSPHPNCVQWGRPSACGGLSGRPDRLSITYGGFLTVRGCSRTRFFLRAPPKVVGFSPEALS